MNKYHSILANALFSRNLSASELARQTGLSQPTVSRALQGLPVIKLGQGRASVFAWVDDVAGHPLYAIDTDGKPQLVGQVYRQPDGRVLLQQQDNLKVYADIPWFLQSVLPAGFLGRLHGEHLSLRLPLNRNPALWSANEAFFYLLHAGDELAGNLLLGKASVRRYLEQYAQPLPCTPGQYDGLAEQVMQIGFARSSVAGEQPKLLAFVQGMQDNYHAIIKYSSPLPAQSPVARRYCDLLVAEHIALECLLAHGMSASESRLLEQGRLYLELRRFDRMGEHGRRGLVSLRDVEAEFIGASEHWYEAADALARLGLIDGLTRQQIHLLYAFGVLIGNTDMHFGNLSFYFEGLQLQGLAPVYDMLPMLYMPVRDEVVERPFRPKPLFGVDGGVVKQALALALDYWQRLARDTRVSAAFREVAVANQGVLRHLPV